MNIKNLSNIVTRNFGRQMLVAQKNSPTMLFVGGVVGVVGTVVLASRASLKLEETLEHTEKDLKSAATCLETRVTQGGVEYTAEDYKKDVALIRVKGAINVVKLYGPAFALGVASVGMLAGSHNMLNKRNVALTAAYKALENRFKDYQKRMENELGKEKHDEILESTTIEVEGDNGKKKKIKVHDQMGRSPYAVFFDEFSKNWSTEADYNSMFLHAQQNYLNDKLKSRGHVFLNEVYDALGVDRTPAGQIVGWVYDPSDEDRDNFVDFGMYDPQNVDAREFVNGRERSILLDFNVDGPIFELLDQINSRNEPGIIRKITKRA